jgi:hypothetical protein
MTVNTTPLDEVQDIIQMPQLDAETIQGRQEGDSVQLNDAIIEQLRSYVRNIAALYRENPFHNSEHASHVTMSGEHLLSHIVAPTDIKCKTASTMHGQTLERTADPLTLFASVFSALIHAITHPVVPNG